MSKINIDLEKEYRKNLGFTNQGKLKTFFDSKDIVRDVDYDYICDLNIRLGEILRSVNSAVVDEIKQEDIETFISINVNEVFKFMKEKGLITKFNNNKQRQAERSYYDWSRGRIVANFFIKALAMIFDVNVQQIITTGLDNIEDPDNFTKGAAADFEITTKKNITYRIEFQCGFQGINDIKEHKVLEARRIFQNKKIRSLIVHVDLFNGKVAFVDISNIDNDSVCWVTRTQFEGKTVFNISEKYFKWSLTEAPPSLDYLISE